MDTKEHEWKDGGVTRHKCRTYQCLVNPISIRDNILLIRVYSCPFVVTNCMSPAELDYEPTHPNYFAPGGRRLSPKTINSPARKKPALARMAVR
jgi:hypothetical protein